MDSFEERFEYLRIGAMVGESTFGFDRYINQAFYRSSAWKKARDLVIIRDNACDLAHPDHPLVGRLIVHHLNPITEEDILENSDILLDPEFLITTWEPTHNAIHYGDAELLPKKLVDRRPGDTKLW